MSKSILLIGNINSPLLRELVFNLRKSSDPPFTRIDIISYDKCKDDIGLFNAVYDQNVSSGFKYPIINSIYRWFAFRKMLLKAGNYDYCHIHSVNFIYSFLVGLIKKKSKTLIVTYWGSDYYRSSKLKRFLHRRLLRYSDMITATTPAILDLVESDFKVDKGKFRLCRFGLTPLNEIKKISFSTKAKALEKLELPASDLVITCGYNASDKQYHELILSQIEQIAPRLPEKTLVILPMTYGGSSSYIEKIEQLASRLPFETKIYSQFLDPSINALLRIVSDIMIQVQPTDQFSGSMQEYIFADNYIITGSWLPYDQLKNKGVFFKKVDEREQIGAAIIDFLDNKMIYMKKMESNQEIIWELSSWEENIVDWLSLYQAD